MPTPIKLPNLGAEASEATIESWLVAVGDTVAAGDPVVAIETEKATVEIEAPVAGTARGDRRGRGRGRAHRRHSRPHRRGLIVRCPRRAP